MGCPLAGLTPNELLDASSVVDEYTDIFLGDKAYTNLPRKFNVTITGCLENCTLAVTQDIALTPAIRIEDGSEIKGFNVAVGGKQGSGGFRTASPLDVFVTSGIAATVCSLVTLMFRDHGPREARNKARLAFLVDEWGVEIFRQELERRFGGALPPAGQDLIRESYGDHVGIFPQKQPGLNCLGLAVPVGRVSASQLLEVARLADAYGNGEIRLTPAQNLIIPNVPDSAVDALRAEPLLQAFRSDPPEVVRGLVSCTGNEYCHFALIDTKGLALKTSRILEQRLGPTDPFTMHWSGCPNACGNHTMADIGLLGKKTNIEGEIVDAVDIFLGERLAVAAGMPRRALENVPCEQFPQVLESLVPPPLAVVN